MPPPSAPGLQVFPKLLDVFNIVLYVVLVPLAYYQREFTTTWLGVLVNGATLLFFIVRLTLHSCHHAGLHRVGTALSSCSPRNACAAAPLHAGRLLLLPSPPAGNARSCSLPPLLHPVHGDTLNPKP
jgi:hypothetical protein